MPKITDKELILRPINFFKEDYDFLQGLYGGNVGVNKIVRTLIHTYCNQVRAEADREINAIEAKAELGV